MAILSVFSRFFGIHDEDFIVTFPRIQVIWDLSFEGKKALWEKLKNAGNTDFSMMWILITIIPIILRI